MRLNGTCIVVGIDLAALCSYFWHHFTMELYQLLAQSQLTAEKILSFLDAKSLGRLAACSVKCRDLANSDSIWLVLLRFVIHMKFFL